MTSQSQHRITSRISKAKQFLAISCLSLLSACGNQSIAPTVSSAANTTRPTTPATTVASATKAPSTPDIKIASQPAPSVTSAPAAPREFRAAWVATIGNVDWPSQKNLSVAQQQAEIIRILNTAQDMHLNAIVLQVRPSADAIYPSELEPWSDYLSGEQGKAPSPFYDPLRYWIDQAHQRGLELHAWFNPYRARSNANKSRLASKHISRTHPELVKAYGDMLWIDPGEPAAMQHTLAVIQDVVRRYDIDGVHIDDYFYPYPVKNAAKTEVDFPDQNSWRNYLSNGGKLAKADWRRHNVNQLVEQIHNSIHQDKPWLRFGISPFGIGKRGQLPPGISGFSQYDKLYADVELWLERGWLDYLAPQLYWPLNQSQQSFTTLLKYWQQQNTQHRHIWPGLYTNRIDQGDKPWPAEEIIRQIDATRQSAGDARAAGHLHFSITALLKNRNDIRSQLRQHAYTSAALIPAMPWAHSTAPGAPQLRMIDEKQVQVIANPADNAHQIAIWRRFGATWTFSVQAITQNTISLALEGQSGHADQLVVSLVNRFGVEGERVASVMR
ncbi:family 10 glycosylhydrolase [Undibacterium sp. Jales W-56]|uniref:glycoside hydrolase family 10 protein n=1 Tax=Undibacterium sp. Jales W-56 TaxID=2897325 RepID=UPI0021D3DB89|nr:family 10 glycosylhydrolase [Undibacterium sp. Jales W-56]MCU6432548.1 family 10 glycosylhydrolase [Undibacterium sp. Jales W-56]